MCRPQERFSRWGEGGSRTTRTPVTIAPMAGHLHAREKAKKTRTEKTTGQKKRQKRDGQIEKRHKGRHGEREKEKTKSGADKATVTRRME